MRSLHTIRRTIQTAMSLFPARHPHVESDVTTEPHAAGGVAMRRAEDLALGIAMAVDSPMCVFDCDLRHVVWNAAAERLTGLRPEMIVGRTYLECVGERAQEQIAAAYVDAIAGRVTKVRARRVLSPGALAPRVYDGTFAPIRGRDGTVIAGMATYYDVTDEHQALSDLQRFAAVVQQTDVAVVMTDSEARITYVNAAWERMTGYVLAEVRDTRLGGRASASDGDLPTREVMRQAILAGSRFVGDIVDHRKDGERFVIAITATPLRDAEGNVTSFVAVERDVTELRDTQRSLGVERAFTRSLLDAAPIAVVATDANHRVVEWNPASVALFGHSRGQAIGAKLDDVIPMKEDRARRHLLDRVFTEGRGFDHERDFVEVDGDEGKQHEVSVTPVRDPQSGRVVYALGTIRDVSARRRAERALRASEAGMKALIQSAASVIISVRTDLTIAEWNDAAVRLKGVSRAEAVGRDVADFFGCAETREAVRARFASVLSGTPELGREVEERLPNGALAVFRWNSNPIVDADGRVIGLLATADDITERRAAEERFSMLFDSSPDAHLIVNSTGVVDCNTAALRLLGLRDRAEIIGVHPSRFSLEIQPDGMSSRSKREIVDSALARNGSHRFDWTLRRSDGTLVPVEVTITAVRLNGEYGHLAVWHDLTERKEAEETVRRERERLAESVRQLKQTQRSLESARDAEREANRAKSAFLANMSHELRTPMNSIIGFTKQVRKNKAGVIPATDMMYLERVEKNGIHLLSLIDTLLDLSKIEAGKLTVDLAPVDIVALARETVAQLEGQPRRACVTVSCVGATELHPLHTDSAKLRQVLINLVGNALKFTHEGSVTVVVEGDQRGCPLAIEVRDTGIGIAPDRLDAIFEKFEQGERTTSRDYGGAGLGLNISRALCDLLGADLTVRSVLAVGTTFRISFQRSN